ncbi:pleckstrin homology domain-containing family A member 7-like isoform X8 [Salvelinus alpinus]|uniref:pleckstrin homology domain-containing family A member 7-like isoform X8 n=1 Tax=Salvelinus alpinus TaxID=8036 RepID=UPI0039FCAE20
MAAPFGRDTLPEQWSFGVCGDGRVFFVHDETSTTTWLHPRTGEPVNSGHMIRSDLPRGWEEGFTDDGAGYFINHNQRTTSFRHPVTGQVSRENVDFILQEQPGGRMSNPQQADLRLSSTISEASTVDTASGSKGSRSSGRVLHFGKREQSIKRNPNVPVVVRGWLYKQDSSGMRLWKRKWFVLADYCLFYYKDSREESVLGSIPLPSYVISAVEPEDHIIRKYAFKASHTGMRSYIYNRSSVIGSQAEHSGMRTYFFSADTQEDMNGWVKAMNQAALMQNHTASLKRPSETSEISEMPSVSERQAVPQTNHVNNYTETAPHLHSDRVVLQPADIHRETEQHCSFWNDTPNPIASQIVLGGGNVEIEMDAVPPSSLSPLPPYSASSTTSAPPSSAQMRAPSYTASTLPPGACLRNGTPTLEPNGMGTGTYQRATLPPQVVDTHRQVQRRSALEQVEHWVKVQRVEHQGPSSRGSTLPRHTPPTQPTFIGLEAYQTLPKTPNHSPPTAARHGEYKYAQDRLSHFRLGPPNSQGTGARDGSGIGGPGTVWQLYEWQQRHQYRHGSPTAPLYTPAPDYPFGHRPPSTVPPSAPRPSSEVPRCVSVPPDPSDIPPLGPPRGSRALSPPRRPHTPADRVVVMPLGERPALDVHVAGSPRRAKSQLLNAATIDRRSIPTSGYITHTVSAPSLHGKTPEELTLLLIQLRRHQAKMASARHHTVTQMQHFNYSPSGPHLRTTNNNPLFSSGPSSLGSLLGPPGPMGRGSSSQVVGSQSLKEATKPVKIAESDVDVKLSGLCEQDKNLKELEVRISSLKDDKDKLESVLDLSRQQMEQYRDRPAHLEKIAYQQRLLQEDVVHIRAQISRVSTEMSRAWEEYSRLESSVEQLRTALQTTMNYSTTSQREKSVIKRELWRMEDVLAGLSASKANYRITINSVQNPERKLVPSVLDPALPTPPLGEVRPPPPSSYILPHNPVPKWAEDEAPPRPPLPRLYDYEDPPPTIPPLPKEAAAVVRHTSVRGLKRQSDERKRDREVGGCVNGDCKVELRSYLSEPELPGIGQSSTGSEGGYQTLPNKGLSGSSSRLNQSSNISSYVTLRRGVAGSAGRERPKSALEQLYSSDQQPQSLAQAPRGRMSAEEQLERMKRHQRALVRERKRNLSQGERHSTTHRSSSSTRPLSSTDLGSWRREQQDFDLQQEQKAQVVERQGAEGQSDEGRRELKERERIQSDEWLTVMATPMRGTDMEPLDYDLDLSRELSKPQKVPISERYVESDPGEPLSQEQMEERQRRAERIINILAKSNVQNTHPSSGVPLDFTDLDLAMQQQKRIMNVSHALASEASIKSKQFTAKAQLNAD